MTRKPKASIFDLDGTLMNKDGKLSKETIEGIKILAESSYVIINSGRNRAEVLELTQEIEEYVDFYISSNGACICDRDKNEIHKASIENNIVRTIIEEYVKFGGKESDIIAVNHDEYLINSDFKDFDREDLWKRNYKIIDCWEYESEISLLMVTNVDGFKNHMKDFLAQRGIQIASETYTTYISIGQKHHGCRQVCDIIDFDIKECFAIGDNGNDIKMLEVVGYPYLMANATEETKQKLKHVTVIDKTNDEHGAIYAALDYVGVNNIIYLDAM